MTLILYILFRFYFNRASKTFGEYNEDKHGRTVLLTNTGICSLTYAKFLKSTCEIDVSDFPFDEQICELVFGSWSMDNRLLVLAASNVQAISRTLYRENGEWELAKAIVSADNVSIRLKDQK